MSPTKVVILMASGAVASGIAEKILNSLGKVDEAAYMNLACKCILAGTGVTYFIQLMAKFKTLG